MKKILVCLAICSALAAWSQPELTVWKMNNNGQTASYWQNSTGNPMNPTFVFHTSAALADVTKMCYDNNYVWIKSEGMTVNMGKFLNPGAPSAQNYTFRLPRVQTVPAGKTISPLVGAIGVLTNGIPIYGLSNAHFYNGTGNNGMGKGVWNVEVYLSEGFVLDTAFGAHPQQQGAYHSHAKPYRLFSATASNVHSPLIGYAFDGYPVYGPYGYSTPTNSASAVTRMKTGFSLRNITTRTTLPYNGTLTTTQYGPPVNSTYPIGTYVEDYEWLSSNNGDLDKYNGRMCVTPEYPGGTYAYFVTINASGTPEYPYIIGPEYYGAPEADDITMGAIINIPPTAICTSASLPTGLQNLNSAPLTVNSFPNPSTGLFQISLPDVSGKTELGIYDVSGRLLYSAATNEQLITVDLSGKVIKGIYLLRVVNQGNEYNTRIVFE